MDVSGKSLFDGQTKGSAIIMKNPTKYGFKHTTPSEHYADPITVLAKVEKPQAKTYDGMVNQNFAFDIDLEDYT